MEKTKREEPIEEVPMFFEQAADLFDEAAHVSAIHAAAWSARGATGALLGLPFGHDLVAAEMAHERAERYAAHATVLRAMANWKDEKTDEPKA